jgi:hypothetical protein
MNKIDVSIVATACRPENWMKIYESIKTSLSFEIVFVGPHFPKFKLPGNFKYIHSLVKPAQCVEIAIRNAEGEFIAIFADDLIFETPFGLDILKQSLEKEASEFDISSCRYKIDGELQSDLSLRFIHGDDESPIVPIVGLMRKKTLEKIGGIDKRFIAVSYDIDLAMRFQEQGGKVLIQDVFVNELSILRRGTRLFNENWVFDRKLLNSLWIKENAFSKSRTSPLQTFKSQDILNYSQGPRGHWKGKNYRFIESIGNIPWLVRRIRLIIREYRSKFL